ncbi:MAG: 9-O-acetylesterase [Candidatus Hydrogenedentota bacterium]
MNRSSAVSIVLMVCLGFVGCQHGGEPAAGELRMPRVFSDNMVLQRDMPIKVWGWATPGAKVVVALDGQEMTLHADADGSWSTELAPMPAGGPHTMTVTSGQTATFKNVLVGDVWICSGQSNMEMNMRPGPLGVLNAETEVAAAKYPNIRLFQTPYRTSFEPLPELAKGEWVECTPETILPFSAVGYFFGRALHEHLDVPIGLINASKGASPAEAWVSEEAIATHPDYAEYMRTFDARIANADQEQKAYEERITNWYASLDSHDAGYVDGKPAWAAETLDTADWSPMDLPCHWETAGYPNLDGFMWFRKVVDVPASWAGKPLKVGLGTINEMDRVWFNGELVGVFERPDGWTAPRVYDVPGTVVKPGRNVIAVRVYDMGNNGGICGVATDMWLKMDEISMPISLAGPWQCKPGLELSSIEPRPQAPELNAQNFRLPGVLYNGMIAAVAPYTLKGAIWYQGESNAGRAKQYQTLFPLMIRDWRARWGQGDFPFLIVQLAAFTERKPEPAEDAWAELREAQVMTLREPNTGMAVTIDIGDAANIHPLNKQDVGKRLALAARKVAYGEDLIYSGPMYRESAIEGNKVRVKFDHVGGGLVAKGDSLTGFSIAGADKKFVWANALIEGDSVVVWSDSVAEPAAVRYAWAANPDCNLFNAEGLPASPFRTDTWPGMTEGVK